MTMQVILTGTVKHLCSIKLEQLCINTVHHICNLEHISGEMGKEK